MSKWMISLSLCLMVVAHAPSVFACGNSARFDKMRIIEKRRPTLAGAEKLFEKANYRGAIRQIFAIYPKHQNGASVAKGIAPESKNRMFKRAMKMAAISVVRTHGSAPLTSAPSDRLKPAKRLGWAHKVLVTLQKQAPDSPELKTYLAESMALQPKQAAEAKKMLLLLSAKDLISGADGYATLARLHLKDKQPQKAKVAMSECKKRSVRATQCLLNPKVKPRVKKSRAKSARNLKN